MFDRAAILMPVPILDGRRVVDMWLADVRIMEVARRVVRVSSAGGHIDRRRRSMGWRKVVCLALLGRSGKTFVYDAEKRLKYCYLSLNV